MNAPFAALIQFQLALLDFYEDQCAKNVWDEGRRDEVLKSWAPRCCRCCAPSGRSTNKCSPRIAISSTIIAIICGRCCNQMGIRDQSADRADA